MVDGGLAERKTKLLARLDMEVLVRGGVGDGDIILTTRLAEVGIGVKVTLP